MLTPSMPYALLMLLLLAALAACTGEANPDAAPPAPEAAPAAPPDGVLPPDARPPEADPALGAAADSVTVVFFGDSLTAGYGLSDPLAQAYPALLAARLRAEGLPARVVNAGNSGETSAGGLRRIDWTVRRTPPDVFVLALGSNDGLRGLPPEQMEQNLAGILERVRAARPEARLVVLGAESLPNYGPDFTGRFREVFPRLAARYDALFVPFLLEGVAGVEALNQPDGVHPTAEGHRRMAEVVWPSVAQAVRERTNARV
ncbi:MAG: arylesterase [Rubricoccaceae bacterium]